ncbi:hypothetical protein CFC21_027545 [Triticum aestivum]|uniref:Ubiquitinyl hydrolase 1 n=2 Tax=Triticum aestivum TaxID=4565 RepID=A0A3B6D5Q3_WHEAT|nr:uncharacterized protein LOC123048413 [Triticum aestivum]KAF7013462.1 hypothetical protein CFC21_027545 [Triticum aestivum]
MGINFKVKLYSTDRAGSSGDGGAGPTPPPAPGLASSPSLDPAPVSASSLPLQPARQPPLTPIVKYTNEGPDVDDDWPEDEDDDWPEDEDDDEDEDQGLDDDDDWLEDEDDEGWEVMQEDEVELPDEEKFYISLFMSAQKKNLPHDLVRHHSVPLNKNEYFSLWENWNQLLDGKRTYLRPLKDCRILSVSGDFRCPDARPRTLGCQEPLLDLVEDYPDNDIFQEIIKVLCQRYLHFRRTRGDGNYFYRAFFFSYLENLGQMQDSQAEVTRLMEHVAVSRENFCRLKWDKAYFLNPEEYFSSVVSELNHLVNSVANGLSSDELYKRSLEEMMPLRIISLLRLLAETEIRTREADYKSFIPGNMNIHQYCYKEVRPLDVKPTMLAMRALTYALGIPLRLEILGRALMAGDLQVKRLDFFPRSESGKGAFHMVQSYWSSTSTPELLELGSGNLLSSDGTPSLTLLCRSEDCDILYR